MATSSKKAGAARKRPPKRQSSRTAYSQYVRLRTILDSLEIGALRFYLDGTNAAEKKRRLEKLEYELLPIIRQVWGGGLGDSDVCPDGYNNCDGVCVPYNCFGSD